MRVLVAGASGAVGQAVVTELRRTGHEVLGVVRGEPGKQIVRALGAQPVLADVLDRDQLLHALDGMAADALIHEATALKNAPTRYRSVGITRTNQLRTTGTRHLLEAAQLLGATRFVVQSMIFGYGFVDHGDKWITEDSPFGQPRGEKSDPATAALASAERQVFQYPGIEGLALRYGFVYGPGPASNRVVTMLRHRMFPIPPRGGGTLGWIFCGDAATATVAALQRGRAGQAYNIVDDQPAPWGDVLDAMAHALGAPRPLRVPGPLIRLAAPFFAEQMINTSMRVSNAKAKSELDWQPSKPSYQHGVNASWADR